MIAEANESAEYEDDESDLIVGEGRDEDSGERMLFIAADFDRCEEITAPSGQQMQGIFLTDDHVLWLIGALLRQLPLDNLDPIRNDTALGSKPTRPEDN